MLRRHRLALFVSTAPNVRLFIYLRALIPNVSVVKSAPSVRAQKCGGKSIRLKRFPHLIFNEAGLNFITFPLFEASVRIVHASCKILKRRRETGLIGGGRWDCWYLTDKLISDFGFYLLSLHRVTSLVGCIFTVTKGQKRSARLTVEGLFLITSVLLLPCNDDRGSGVHPLGLHICIPPEVMTSFLAK